MRSRKLLNGFCYIRNIAVITQAIDSMPCCGLSKEESHVSVDDSAPRKLPGKHVEHLQILSFIAQVSPTIKYPLLGFIE